MFFTPDIACAFLKESLNKRVCRPQLFLEHLRRNSSQEPYDLALFELQTNIKLSQSIVESLNVFLLIIVWFRFWFTSNLRDHLSIGS